MISKTLKTSNISYYSYPGIVQQVNKKAKLSDVLTKEDIIRTCFNYYNINYNEVQSKDKHTPYVKARRASYFFLRKNFKISKRDTGKIFDRDHSSVIHSLNVIKDELGRYDDVTKDFEEINYLLLTLFLRRSNEKETEGEKPKY